MLVFTVTCLGGMLKSYWRAHRPHGPRWDPIGGHTDHMDEGEILLTGTQTTWAQ